MDAAEKTCPVCHDKLQDPTRLPCNHEFCQTCLQRSLDFRRHCPVCRKPVHGDYLSAAVPSHTRRSRVRSGRTRDAMISPFLGSAVGPFAFPGLSNQINQLRTPLNWFDVPLIRTATSAPGPAFTPPTLLSTAPRPPTLLSTAPRPPTLWSTASALTPPTRPLISFLTSNAAQVAGAGHPPIGRLVHNYTVPPVNATGPPGFSVTESENEEIHNLLNEHVLEEQREALPSSVRVYVCPYCQQGDMDELDLRDHCNALHHHDPTPVVCPVCVALPHGDENYYSRNFIGHLNLRHNYYSEDVTDTHRSDAMNIQAAILESLRSLPTCSTKF